MSKVWRECKVQRLMLALDVVFETERGAGTKRNVERVWKWLEELSRELVCQSQGLWMGTGQLQCVRFSLGGDGVSRPRAAAKHSQRQTLVCCISF